MQGVKYEEKEGEADTEEERGGDIEKNREYRRTEMGEGDTEKTSRREWKKKEREKDRKEDEEEGGGRG